MYSVAAAKASLFTLPLARAGVARANGNSMYPACAMEEYASSLTTWRCCSATRFPMVIVNSESTAKIGAQKSARGRNATNMIWRSPANPAALDATDRNAATGTGAPSYVSGAQNWNGKAETLKANPATTNRIAARARLEFPAEPASFDAITERRVDPVT